LFPSAGLSSPLSGAFFCSLITAKQVVPQAGTLTRRGQRFAISS
jgi:hypothetical protein